MITFLIKYDINLQGNMIKNTTAVHESEYLIWSHQFRPRIQLRGQHSEVGGPLDLWLWFLLFPIYRYFIIFKNIPFKNTQHWYGCFFFSTPSLWLWEIHYSWPLPSYSTLTRRATAPDSCNSLHESHTLINVWGYCLNCHLVTRAETISWFID